MLTLTRSPACSIPGISRIFGGSIFPLWSIWLLMFLHGRIMATQQVPVWIRIERPGVNLNSSRIFCSRDQILVDLIESAVVKLPSASNGIDASFLRPQDADGNVLDLDMAVSRLPARLGQSANQPLRFVCDIPLQGVCLNLSLTAMLKHCIQGLA